jgi:hypothetical protein
MTQRRRDRRWLLALGLPALLALGQQQWLMRRPPRLLALEPAAASAGPAALSARFSRPVDTASLQAQSRLQPALAHRWHGEGDRVMLSLAPGQRLMAPLTLELAGRDRRGLPLPPRRWRWDPRPRLLAVMAEAGGGERLRLRDHDGRWRSLTPPVARILALEPLGDGSGVAFTTEAGDGGVRVWRLPLQQTPLVDGKGTAAPSAPPPVQAGRARALGPGDLGFAHLSADRRGALLVQAGGPSPGDPQTLYWPAGGDGPQALAIRATGPIRLLPEGGAAVVPEPEGLGLLTLPPRAPAARPCPAAAI